MPEIEHPILDVSVLYVEDEDDTREGIAEFLSLRLRKVYTASNGKEGLEAYKQYHPDVIITDIKMPVMNGLEFAKAVKAINKDIPFIITTAYNDVEFLLDSIDLGINQFILKPVLGTRLMEAVQKCLRGSSLERELVQIAGLLSEYKNAIDSSGLVLKFDQNGIITYVNEALCSISGYTKEELIGKSYDIIRHNDEKDDQMMKEVWESILHRKTWKGIKRNRHKSGYIYYVNITIVPISDIHDQTVEFMSIGYEVTELVQKEEELLRQLFTDRATGLPNRTKLLEDVEQSEHPVLFLINVDSFQQINDFYGNEIGDFLIFDIGKRLKRLLSTPEYRLYRMPADEYAILLDKEISEKDVEPIIHSIQEEISEKPFFYRDNTIHIMAAIGIALGKETANLEMKGSKWHSLALNADMALKKAKKLQKHYVFYDESMQITKEYENNIKWTNKLRDAIKEDRIVPFFQPILNNHTKAVEKYECLVRLIDKDGDVKSPILFLDLAKKTRLYHHITRVMLTKSMEVFKNTEFEFSINLSVDDILDEETNHFIKNTLKQYAKVAPRLVFEILESEGIENYAEVKNFIQEVKEYSCKLAVDDFGAGYSNFSHVLSLNIDYIKIDSSLIKFVNQDRNTEIITQTIVDFSKKLGIQTIAEFVCSKEIYEKLLILGVDYSQGYFFGEPKNIIA